MTIADVLASAQRPAESIDPAALDDLRGQLERSASTLAHTAGWTPDAPLRLTKSTVALLLRCPRRAVTSDDTTPNADLALGAIADAAAKVATIRTVAADDPATLDLALGWLRAERDDDALVQWIDALDDDEAGELLATARERIARLLEAWPPVEDGTWPRVDEWARLHLAGGAVSVAGKLDAAFGGPPTQRPAVVVEVKGGMWRDEHRADAHLYGLLVALRDGRAPHAVVTVCAADGRTNVELIRTAVLESAAVRVAGALEIAADLAAGEAPNTVPGPYCTTCPALTSCADGQRHLADARRG